MFDDAALVLEESAPEDKNRKEVLGCAFRFAWRPKSKLERRERQIITGKHWRFKNWACGSKSVLATGDGGLANAPNKKDCASGIV
jgi:hypothetical protein